MFVSPVFIEFLFCGALLAIDADSDSNELLVSFGHDLWKIVYQFPYQVVEMDRGIVGRRDVTCHRLWDL